MRGFSHQQNRRMTQLFHYLLNFWRVCHTHIHLFTVV